jgi:DNA-binding PadR family transcriptional regulator
MRSELRTPLALAVLNLLYERSMHPYEMQVLMRERGHHQVIKLKGGSLYSTIERLTAAGLVEPVETSREGRRPERTVYALTAKGRDELMLWLRELISQPAQEYPWFGAALAFLGALPPDEARRLLEVRVIALEAEVAAGEAALHAATRGGLPRLFAVESEYAVALRRAELAWVTQIVDDMRTGKLEWPPEAHQFYAERGWPSETLPVPEKRKEKES